MSDLLDITARLKASWRAILDAEQARGQAMAAGEAQEAQEAYQAALVLFRRAQIEAFTVTLGAMPLVWEQLRELAERLDRLERAVGEASRVARLETRVDIIDRILFFDPLNTG
jgi:hypothetical protein